MLKVHAKAPTTARFGNDARSMQIHDYDYVHLFISQHVNDKVSREKQNDIYILD